jgi:hypothetical protein
MAVWTTAYENTLPDDNFAFIEDGGTKDDSGRTTPRELRHLPYKDANGNVDLPHLRNALARLSQTKGISADEEEKIRAKLQKLLGDDTTKADRLDSDVVRLVPLTLDANGDLPTRIPLFVTGDWDNSVKGNFSIKLDDLKSIKEHFDAGIGFPTEDASTGLAIDFMHDYAGPAAAWIKGLELDADEATGKGTLYANPVQWTDEGEAAIRGGRFKCISPMGNFGRKNGQFSMWSNPTNLKQRIADVLTGAGLTNIPFLRGMSPILAAALPDGDELAEGGMIFVSDNYKETKSMNLDALRVKEKKDLKAEELSHLAEHKDELTAEERVKFGLEEEKKADPAAPPADTLSAEDRELLAAVKAGTKKVVDNTNDNDNDEMSDEDMQMMKDIKAGKKKVVDASQKLDTTAQDTLSTEDRQALDALKRGDKKLVDAATVEQLDRLPSLLSMEEEYRYNKADQVVLAHVKRGAVKPDQRETTVKMLLAMEGDARKAFEDHLSALPSNELLAKEVGHSDEVVEDIQTELMTKTLAHQKEAKDAGRLLSYGEAQNELLTTDENLRKRVEANRNKQ